jgi:signal transduction histidine kinase/CheY-like chemotaxis protein
MASDDKETIKSLLRITEKLNSTSDLPLLLDDLLKEAIGLAKGESGLTGLLREKGMVCHKYFRKGAELPFEYCWPCGHGIPGWLIEYKEPYLTNDAPRDSQIDREFCAQFDIKSALSIPIINGSGEVLGFFEVHNKKDKRGFTEDDKRKLIGVSQMAAVAVQNSSTSQEIRQVKAAQSQLSAIVEMARMQFEEEREALETINKVGQMLSAELDLQQLVQALTDAGTEITDAQFGSFFYNVKDERGSFYKLYTLSGANREHFAHFPMPRVTDLFGPTYSGEGVIRIADVKQDARYGKNSPFSGIPEGHLPVTSYLAVPVVSRSGEVLGGLFFGHSKPGIFTERHERIVTGLAGQAAIAMDNARLYEAARKARQEAETANRLKDEFLATVSHELRTPLNAIFGWSRLLRTGRLDSASASHAVEIIVRNAKAQEQIIEDILDVSRIITGKIRLHVSPIEIAPAIEAAIDSLRPTADARGVELQTVLDTESNVVLGDTSRLQQVVWNLLSNAIKFSPEGGRVQVTLERMNSHHVEIRVSDTGQGISMEFLPYVFERFRQADSSTTRKYGGLGLGLAIVRHLVELHGGTVAADSPGAGLGATFTVRLPLAVMREKEETTDQPQKPSFHEMEEGGVLAEFGWELSGVQVLIVDDDADARELLTAILQQYGAEVRGVGSTPEGIEAVKAWRPDVLVSDIGMPGRDGYELIREVRALSSEHGGDIPAIALTGYARSEDRLKALRSGFQKHVTKPVEPENLAATIAGLIRLNG